MVRVASAELIIEDDTATGISHGFQRFEIVVRGSGTAVENQQWELAWLFAVSDNAVPSAITTKGNESFSCREILHFSPSFCISVISLGEQLYLSWCVLSLFVQRLDFLRVYHHILSLSSRADLYLL